MSEFSERPASRYDEVVANMRRQLQERLYGLPWDELAIVHRQAVGFELGVRSADSMRAATRRAGAIDRIVKATFQTPVGPGVSTPDVAPAQPDYQGRHSFDEARKSSFFRRYGPRGPYGFRTQERAS